MNNPYADSNNLQQVPQRGGSSTGKVLIIIFGVLAIVGLACAGILAALLIPAVGAARSAAQRMQSSNNMKQISLALLNYESSYGSFPPAYTEDANGNKLHSWRTLILPFIEQQALYNQIDLTKPWDDPVNKPFTTLDIMTYQSPACELNPGETNYLAVVDPAGIFSGTTPTRFPDIADGSSNTILAVEVDASQAVPWMSPNDLDLPTFSSGTLTTPHTGVANVAFSDGSVIQISTSVSGEDRKAMVTKDGGEIVNTTGY